MLAVVFAHHPFDLRDSTHHLPAAAANIETTALLPASSPDGDSAFDQSTDERNLRFLATGKVFIQRGDICVGKFHESRLV